MADKKKKRQYDPEEDLYSAMSQPEPGSEEETTEKIGLARKLLQNKETRPFQLPAYSRGEEDVFKTAEEVPTEAVLGQKEKPPTGPAYPEMPEAPTLARPKAQDFSQALSGLEGRIAQLPPEAQSTYLEELKQAREAFQESKGALQKGELAEKLIHAFTQLAAGWYGLKHGQDLSGIKFDPADWKQKYQESLDDYRMSLQGAEAKETGREKAVSQRERLQDQKERLLAMGEESKYRTKEETREESNRTLIDDWRMRAQDAVREARAIDAKLKEDRKIGMQMAKDRASAADRQAKIFQEVAAKGKDEAALEAAIRSGLPPEQADEEINKATTGWFMTSDETQLRNYAAGMANSYRQQAERYRQLSYGELPKGPAAPAAAQITPEEAQAELARRRGQKK